MPWRVVEVRVLDDFRIHVRFVDGLDGDVNMKCLVHAASAGVFAQLADPDVFAQAFVENGAVTWPGEVDLAPDRMHAEIKEKGVWVVSAPAR
jgi:hypothetical protein